MNSHIKKPQTLLVILLLVLILLSISAYLFLRENTSQVSNPNQGNFTFEIIAENLRTPWEIGFLPNGELLISQRPGNLVRIRTEKSSIEIPSVREIGEGGLLGFTLHPDFENNNLIYFYITVENQGQLENRVEQYFFNLSANILTNRKIIISAIPASSVHNGGRIKFGPDGYLYISTGDSSDSDLAQNINSLAGKILRLDENGNIPSDNPFSNPVYSYGHRNVQGLTWDSENQLWATEHGRSGMQSGLDELNLIQKGANYGWPIIQGDDVQTNLHAPIIHSGTDTWAPAGAVFFDNSIFFTGLRGQALYKYNLQDKTLRAYFNGEFGRLRAITLKNDSLYISTSNNDGRGNPKIGDDKVIKINLSNLV